MHPSRLFKKQDHAIPALPDYFPPTLEERIPREDKKPPAYNTVFGGIHPLFLDPKPEQLPESVCKIEKTIDNNDNSQKCVKHDEKEEQTTDDCTIDDISNDIVVLESTPSEDPGDHLFSDLSSISSDQNEPLETSGSHYEIFPIEDDSENELPRCEQQQQTSFSGCQIMYSFEDPFDDTKCNSYIETRNGKLSSMTSREQIIFAQ